MVNQLFKLFSKKGRRGNIVNGTTHGVASIPGRDKVIDQLIADHKFTSIFDIGCGYGDLFYYLESKQIEFNGYGCDVIPKHNIKNKSFKYIESDILGLSNNSKYDLVFCSHVIEHVPDTQTFLKRMFTLVNPGGVFCLIWPPPKKQIVGGHVHVFNQGLMLYNLVRVGVDCSLVKIYRAGYNLAIIGKYVPFELPKLSLNKFELELLAPYFPFPVVQGFDGDLRKITKKL